MSIIKRATEGEPWTEPEQDHPLAHLIPPLDIADRCDRCGARAYIGVLMTPTGEPLLFCAHHGAAHLPKLQLVAVAIRDDTARLATES